MSSNLFIEPNPPINEMEKTTIIVKNSGDFIPFINYTETKEAKDEEQLRNCTINIIFAYTHLTSQKVMRLNINNILISDIIADLTVNGLLNEMKTFAVSYYDIKNKMFRYYGKYPFKTVKNYPIERSNEVTIKIRQILEMGNALRMEYCEDEQDNVDEKKENNHINDKSKRAKERKISDIIKKVYMWRKMYNGLIREDTNEYLRYYLKKAAEKIGISKKSLDDYLIQLRIGKMYGFDFNEHKNDKVGVLRSFVKKHRSQLDEKFFNEKS